MDSTGSTNSNSFHDYNASAEIPERLQKLANESVLPFLYDKMKLYPAFDPWNTTSETNNASIDFMSSAVKLMSSGLDTGWAVGVGTAVGLGAGTGVDVGTGVDLIVVEFS